MVAVSSLVISRLSLGAATSYSVIEHMTRRLARVDRWVSRSRRDLLASDLASLLNALMGGQVSEAVEVDTMLRGLKYLSSIPAGKDGAKQEPHLGKGNWGVLLEGIISGAPSSDSERRVNVDSALLDNSGPPMLPHTIEVCVSPPSIVLVWLGSNGAPKRLDLYGLSALDRIKRPTPYGLAALLHRKTFVDGQMIVLAGQILRDMSPQLTASSAGSAPADAGIRAAAHPGRGNAAALSDQPANTELDGSTHTQSSDEKERTQSRRGSRAGPSKHRKDHPS